MSMPRMSLLLVCLLVFGCAREQAEMGASEMAVASAPSPKADTAGGDAADPGAMLAYEHDVQVRVAADAIPVRLQAAQEACTQRRFGECVVLNVQRSGGEYPSGRLTVRIVPAGVEPMVALASEGAEVGSRSTRAEDLAVVVRDNDRERDRLQRELARLQEFQQRRDLAVADMIALAKQVAETEAQLQAAEQEAAQHRRRIDTQLLTLAFEPPGGQAGRNEIARALRDFLGTLSLGAAWTIRALAFLIPLGLLLAGLLALRRHWRRRRTPG